MGTATIDIKGDAIVSSLMLLTRDLFIPNLSRDLFTPHRRIPRFFAACRRSSKRTFSMGGSAQAYTACRPFSSLAPYTPRLLPCR